VIAVYSLNVVCRIVLLLRGVEYSILLNVVGMHVWHSVVEDCGH
jgi:hypothetical protein